MLILAEMPRASAAEVLRCDEKSLASILTYRVNEAVERQDMSDVRSLAIDETSQHRGHDYVTVVIDADKRRVIDVKPTREKASAFAEKLEQHAKCAVLAVTSDMSYAYLSGIANFPHALRVIDTFHVKQVLINALDAVRRQEQKAADDKRTLFMGRRLL